MDKSGTECEQPAVGGGQRVLLQNDFPAGTPLHLLFVFARRRSVWHKVLSLFFVSAGKECRWASWGINTTLLSSPGIPFQTPV